MSETARISPQEARQKVVSGQAMLVCAHADDAKCVQYHLEGAIPLSAFQAKAGGLAKDREIIFYCN
ncbi:MAG: hypothetical protein OEM01_05440 [Desulfobulbaceae bacterium]|nr:hypothetical protein [Desulfobulbaceae bacterium]